MGSWGEAYSIMADEKRFRDAGIFVGAPEKAPSETCTQGRWHANDANGESLDCSSADVIIDGHTREGGNYVGQVKSVHLVVREPIRTATLCQDPNCKHTNWGGWNRVHDRGSDCPPL